MVVVQLEAAGGAGGAGGTGAEGGVGGAGGLKNDKILTYYYAFPAHEADQLEVAIVQRTESFRREPTGTPGPQGRSNPGVGPGVGRAGGDSVVVPAEQAQPCEKPSPDNHPAPQFATLPRVAAARAPPMVSFVFFAGATNQIPLGQDQAPSTLPESPRSIQRSQRPMNIA